jgi:thiol-disulfide isomerase/thioredoxin
MVKQNYLNLLVVFIVIVHQATSNTKNIKITKQKNLLVLNDANFDEAVKRYKYLFVEVCKFVNIFKVFIEIFIIENEIIWNKDAPWCSACKAAKPHYEKAADAFEFTSIRLGKVDGTKELDVYTKLNITEYPTFFFYENGEKIRYTGKIWLNILDNYLIEYYLV